ncbi:MAG: zinc metalloprotease HtpX [Candidatus Nanopelagicales bacterium]|nr:zinc metalloprotease HtpX [Candidatus Nanopelagicales bacterium]
MARTRYASDPGLTRRMFGTMGGLFLLYVAIGVALIIFGVSAVFVLIIAGGLLWGQWYFCDSLALRAMRAEVVTPEQAPQLHGVVDRLCLLADMPKPRIAVADTEVPNAFATGRSAKRAVVCVTTGLLRRVDRDELEAVLSHELSHVAHRDVTVMTIASFAAIVAGLLARSALWGGMIRGRRDQNTAAVVLVVLLVSALVYVLSYILTAALSRYRELAADRGGALLTGNPRALASALQKISGEVARIPTTDLRRMEPVSSMAFVPALSGTRGFDLARIFASHPPLQKRLENLAKISTELGRE